MGWPLSQDYNEAVQNPRTSFADPELRDGTATAGPLGLPLPRSGNFADVYQFKSPRGQTWAVKCFTRHVPGLQERYTRIATHLRAARLPFTVRFTFLEKGIRVRSDWYPVLKMQWVEGFTLNEFVRTHADRPDYLRALLGLWVRLSRRLREAKIAHADLQHGNILLVPAASANKLSVKLIDYDGMWVPALAGTPSGEVGHPAYQHPARIRDRVYSSDVDRFPHLVIATALRATAVAGKRLWDRFDNGDSLLFRESDFADPDRSQLFRALWDLDDPTVTNLVGLLVDHAGRSLAKTPWLDEVLTGDRPATVGTATLGRAADRLGVSRRTSRSAVPDDEVFSVPEQANEFGDMVDAEPRPAATTPLIVPLLLAGGGIVALAAVVLVAVLAWRGLRPGPDDLGTGPGNEGQVEARPGIGVSWVALPPGPPQPRLHDLSPEARKTQATYGNPRQFALPRRGPLGVWLMANGRRAIIASTHEVSAADLTTQRVERIVPDVGDLVRVAVSPDGKTVVTAGSDHVVRCWDVEAGAGESWMQTFPGAVTALEITPDGQRVAVSGEQVGYVEWALATGAVLRKHEGLRASRLAFTEDGQRAIAARAEGVELWSLADGQVTPLAPGFLASAICVSTAHHGFAADPGGETKSWDLTTGQPLTDRQLAIVGRLTALEVCGDLLIAGTDSGDIVVVRPDGTQQAIPLLKGASRITSLVPTRDGTYAFAGLETGTAQLIRLSADEKTPKAKPKDEPGDPTAPLRLVREIAGPGEPVAVGVSPDGGHLVIAGATRAVVHETTGLKEVGQVATDPERVIRGAAVVGDKLVLSDAKADGSDGRIRSFDLTGKPVGQPWALPSPAAVTNLQPVPGKNWVLGDVGGVRTVIFDVTTGQPVEGFLPGRGWSPVSAVPDAEGKRIACVLHGSKTSALQLWSVENKALGPPLEASDGIAHVAFLPGGNSVVGAWTYGRIKIWDTSTGKLSREVDHDGVGVVQGIRAMTAALAILDMSRGRAALNMRSGRFLDLSVVPDGRTAWFSPRSWVTSVTNGGRVSVLKADLKELGRLAEVPAPKLPEWDAKLVRDAVAGPPVGAFLTADGLLTVGTAGGRVVRYKAERLIVDRELDTGETALTGIGKAPDRLFTHGPKFGVRMWDSGTFEKLVDYPKTSVPARLFGVRPDGTTFYLVASQMTETEIKTKVTKPGPATTLGSGLRTLVAYSADGEVMASRWANGHTAAFRDRGREQKFDRPDKGPAVVAQALALSADGKYAVIGTNDGRVTVNQTLSGKVQHTEVAHKAGDQVFAVTDAVFVPGPGPTRFLTTAADGRTILWALDKYLRLREFTGLPGDRKLAVSPDGRTVIVHGPAAIEVFELP
jgi:WD40 repeat protein